MKWISCNDKTPTIDAVVRRVGYTDTLTSGDYKDNLRKRLINAVDYEWLDEKWHDRMGHELSLMLYRAIKILGKKELFESDHKFIDQANQIIVKYSNPLDALRSDNAPSPTTADASVLVEALEYLINDIKRKPNDTRYATAIKKASDALAQYNALPGSQGGEEWKEIQGKRYLLVNDKVFQAVQFDQWNDGDFEADAVNGGFRVLISKNTSGYFVANAMDEGGNNCREKYANAKVTLLNPIQPTIRQSPSSIEESGLKEGEDKFWDDFAIEYEALQRMEENTWEWNRSILKEKYRITKKQS